MLTDFQMSSYKLNAQEQKCDNQLKIKVMKLLGKCVYELLGIIFIINQVE